MSRVRYMVASAASTSVLASKNKDIVAFSYGVRDISMSWNAGDYFSRYQYTASTG